MEVGLIDPQRNSIATCAPTFKRFVILQVRRRIEPLVEHRLYGCVKHVYVVAANYRFVFRAVCSVGIFINGRICCGIVCEKCQFNSSVVRYALVVGLYPFVELFAEIVEKLTTTAESVPYVCFDIAHVSQVHQLLLSSIVKGMLSIVGLSFTVSFITLNTTSCNAAYSSGLSCAV